MSFIKECIPITTLTPHTLYTHTHYTIMMVWYLRPNKNKSTLQGTWPEKKG